MIAKVSPSASVRYFGPGDAASAVERVIARVSTTGAVPSDLNLGGSYEPSAVIEALRHLARYWSPTPPSRGTVRRKSYARIHVVHDFEDIVTILAGESKELDFQTNIETWTVENESENGYGATIPENGSDWLRVGALLGIKLAEGNAWGVGIIRRIANDGKQHRYVGIQALAKGGMRVQLNAVGSRGSGKRESDDAVLLPSLGSDSTGEINLLMRLGMFSPQQSFQMRAYGREYLLMPKQLIEGGQDFDMARFKVLQRAA
jgi:hypothetical protein